QKGFALFCAQLFLGELLAERFCSILRSTFSWRASCGKVLLDYVRNLFLASFLRKSFALFCAQLFRSARPAESFYSFSHQTFPWRASRGKVLLDYVRNLFAACLPLKPFALFCA